MQAHSTHQRPKNKRLLPWLVVVVLCACALGVWFARQGQPAPQSLTMLFEVDGPEMDDALYDRQLLMLQTLASSEVVAFNALQHPDAEPWIDANEQFDDAARALHQSVAMEAVQGTNLIRLQLSSQRPVDLEAVALAYGNAMIDHVLHINQTVFAQKVKPLHDALIAKEQAINEALRHERLVKEGRQQTGTAYKLLEKKTQLQNELRELQNQSTHTSSTQDQHVQVSTYSHRVLLDRAREKELQQHNALQELPAGHPLFDSMQTALKQTQEQVRTLEQQMQALQSLVVQNSNAAVQLDKRERIQALQDRILKLDKALAMIPPNEQSPPAVGSGQLFKELELLENELIEQKKNGLQLSLSWFSKPTP
ncbi:MAG TPA: hypothetical protein VFV39_07430 [Limnobacter sp.]|nr:hypothetical protein [Limnobacter sp.]